MTAGDALAAKFCAEVAADDTAAGTARSRLRMLLAACGPGTRDHSAVAELWRGLPGRRFRILTRVEPGWRKLVLTEWRLAPGDWSEPMPAPGSGITIVLHALTATRRGANLDFVALFAVTRHALAQWFGAAPDSSYHELFGDLSPLVHAAENTERIACPTGSWWQHTDRRNPGPVRVDPLRVIRTYARAAP